MTTYVFANFAFSTLAEPIEAGSTLIRIRSTDQDKFPILGAGERFYCTIWDRENIPEIVEVTARSAEVLTVLRGADGTSSRAWLAGTPIRLAMTKGLFESIRASSLTTLLTSPTNNQVLAYDGTGLKWINKTLDYAMIPGLQTDLDALSAGLASHTHTADDIDGGDPIFNTLRFTEPYGLVSGFNLNNLTDSGWFSAVAPTNGPEEEAGNWLIESISYSSINAVQFAYKITSGPDVTYFRFKKGDVWEAWAVVPGPGHSHDDRYYRKSELPAYVVMLTGNQTVKGIKTAVKDLSGAGYFAYWEGYAADGEDASYAAFYQNTDRNVELRFVDVDGVEYIRLGSRKVIFNVPIEFGEDATGGVFDGATDTDDGKPGFVPAPEAGQQETVLYGAGDWQRPRHRKYKTTDQTISSSTTLANDDTLSFTAAADTAYWFKFVVFVTTAATPDFSFQIDGPGATGINIIAQSDVKGGAGSPYAAYADNFSTRVDVTNTTDVLCVRLEGIAVVGGTGGPIRLKWAQRVSDAADTKVKRGSYVEYETIS